MGDREQDYGEEWRNIPGEANYEVSSSGRVKSCARTITRNNGRVQTIKERILKQAEDDWGYYQVRINRKTYKVHRLVAMAFMGERPTNNVIRHLDGNNKNNTVSNLMYGTYSQNVLDCYDYRGVISAKQKLNEEKARTIMELISSGEQNRHIAKRFGVSEQTICDIKHGRIYNWVV